MPAHQQRAILGIAVAGLFVLVALFGVGIRLLAGPTPPTPHIDCQTATSRTPHFYLCRGLPNAIAETTAIDN